MTSTRVGLASAMAVLAVCVAACSSSGSGTPGTGPDPSGSAPAGPTAVTHTAGAHCDQLTKAQVQPLLTVPIASVKVTAKGSDGQQCVFGGKTSGAIDVLVLTGTNAAAAYQAEVSGYSDGPASVPGIGDKATRDVQDDQINALKGDVYCAVSVGSGEDVPGIGGLEEAAGYTTHIAESANAAAAEALGTLCNRIYGSGNTTPDLVAITAGASASPLTAPSAVVPVTGSSDDLTSKACSAITLSDAQALVVERISAVQFTPGESASASDGAFQCGIGTDVRVLINPHDSSSSVYTSNLAAESVGKGAAVPGVGDIAAYAQPPLGVPDLFAHQGAVTCEVSTDNDAPDLTAHSDSGGIAPTVSAKAAAAYAGLEGKVCIDIFGAIG